MRLRITRVFDAIVNVSAALAGGLLVALMLATTVKVFFRYVLGEGLNGVDQISGTLLLYIAFLGAAWVAREDEHVRVDLLVKGLSHRLQRWLGVVTSIIGRPDLLDTCGLRRRGSRHLLAARHIHSG